MALKEILQRGKSKDIMYGGNFFALWHGNTDIQGKEIAGYIHKNPSAVTRYLKEKEDLEKEVEKVIEKIKRANIKKSGLTPYFRWVTPKLCIFCRRAGGRQHQTIRFHRLNALTSSGDKSNHSPSPRLSANRLCQ